MHFKINNCTKILVTSYSDFLWVVSNVFWSAKNQKISENVSQQCEYVQAVLPGNLWTLRDTNSIPMFSSTPEFRKESKNQVLKTLRILWSQATSWRSIIKLEKYPKRTATESNIGTLPCLSGLAATAVATKLWLCLLADTFRRKNVPSS